MSKDSWEIVVGYVIFVVQGSRPLINLKPIIIYNFSLIYTYINGLVY